MKTTLTPPIKFMAALCGLILTSPFLSGLSNSDVITLHEAGIGTDTMVLAINNTEEKDFDTSAGGLVELKEAGVDETVIQAILLATGSPKQEPALMQAESPPLAEESVVEAPPAEVVKAEPPAPKPQVTVEKVKALPAPVEPEIPMVKPQKRPPQPLYRPAPVYPSTLKEKGITGSVRVQFTVDASGDVQDINVLESDHDLFSAAASEALMQWKFNPGTEDGAPVSSGVKLEIPFNIKGPVSSMNRAPKALYNPKPAYPKALRQEGVTGNVKVQFVVNTSGEVQDISVVSSDNELFTEEAMKVLQRWKFAPALQNGQPIDSRVQFSIPFKITD